jgi:adenylosuccinate lyase
MMLLAISPVDGRYHSKTKELSKYFSEYALIKYRVKVELEYFKLLCQTIPQLKDFDQALFTKFDESIANFSIQNAERIKEIEKTTNHDVKAVEYFIKDLFDGWGQSKYKEFIHFGLTSQDINNTAFPLMVENGLNEVLTPLIKDVIGAIKNASHEYEGIAMLARTHGQPASPTTLGKEFEVFVERLEVQLDSLKLIKQRAKFGGATGNLNAHKVAYPSIDWVGFANTFVSSLGLQRAQKTTQIEHYDQLSALCHALVRIDNILIDFCRDIWTYISMDYFKQKVVKNEVGSSAMPHKVNPIDFENAEGNLGIANAIFEHLAAKLPISRLQRDLTDSTVLRNIGVPFSHVLISLYSIHKGMQKLLINQDKINADLDDNWAVVAEAIQNILRREQYPSPYEALKDLTRGKSKITKSDIQDFVKALPISDAIKDELLQITPFNYIGYY